MRQAVPNARDILNVDAAASAARRHSQRVRMLRRALPALAGLLAIGTAMTGLDLRPHLPLINLGDLQIGGSTITMTNPKLSGYGKQDEAYRVTAAKAEQDIDNPGAVRLEQIDGVLIQADGRETALSADEGRFNTEARQLILEGDVVVSSSTGYVAHLERAEVDVAHGRVQSNKPIKIEGLDGTIRADALTLEDQGKHITFEGRVRLDVMLRPKEENSQ